MRNVLSSGEAAAMLGLSRERVLQLTRERRLRVVARDGTGRRLFRPQDVERLKAERERQRPSK